jgi:hypothetical protein
MRVRTICDGCPFVPFVKDHYRSSDQLIAAQCRRIFPEGSEIRKAFSLNDSSRSAFIRYMTRTGLTKDSTGRAVAGTALGTGLG